MSPQQPTDDREPMDQAKVRETLGHALSLQARSLLEMTLLAGALSGLAGIGAKTRLRQFVQHELEDTYLLTEKLTSLGGTAALELPEVSVAPDAAEALARLVEHEQQVVAALHAVIPHSGQEPRSEALEHLLEHVIMRKQQQVNFLGLAVED